MATQDSIKTDIPARGGDLIDLPRVVSTGEFRLGNLVMRCHVLSDGQRVIDGDSFAAFMAWMEDGGLVTYDDAIALAKLIKGV